MEETRNPKPAEDVAGDTETANQRVSSESDQPSDMNSSESFAASETNEMNENTSDEVTPALDAADIEQDARNSEADGDDPM
ncbi:MAG: hypothetical protein H0V88_04990 [Pyrinomonadaceae bacterium]|nr:hypothetical protein [Pyrinomonadaceae bacterium]